MFNSIEMKNFMEPIFAETGYRQETIEVNDKPNILLIHSNCGVGDFVAISPGLRALRRIYDGAHITLVVAANAGNLAELCPYIDELILNPAKYNWRDFLSLYQWNAELSKKLLIRRYDLVFPMCGFPSMYLLGYMGGGKKILSFAQTSKTHFLEPFGGEVYRPFLTEMSRVTPRVNETNMFSSYMALSDGLIRHPIVNREGEVWLSAGDRAFARDLLISSNTGGGEEFV